MLNKFEENFMWCYLSVIGALEVIDPKYGDFKLQVFPFQHDKPLNLPEGFKLWEKQIQTIIDLVPVQEGALTHYLTIDSQFFTTEKFQRREGVHVDGNFCVDPNFQWRTWGGTGWAGTTTDDGKIIRAFASPYSDEIPFGNYISETQGGILCASSYAGCEAWNGYLANCVGNEGSYPEEFLPKNASKQLSADILYFMSSNTPHRTLLIPKGTRRTLIRITLNHNYDNRSLALGN